MSGLFKRIYVATIIESAMLAIILYSIPAEAGSNLFLGRSIYRWAVLLPALVLAVAGLIHLIMLLFKNRFDILTKTLQSHIASLKENFGDHLVFYNLLYIILLFVSILFLRRQETSTFVRLAPWLIFATIVLIQADYFSYRLASETAAGIDFKRSLLNIPATSSSIFLEGKGTYTSTNKGTIFWFWAICTILILTFLFVGYYTITFAQLNTDEGWYLYAARQVYHGQRLYQDFAFTQMPLIPYIYGLGILLWKSIYAGRLISFLIFCTSLTLVYQISKKTFNPESFLWLLLIFTVYPDGFYFDTIVKTYALTFFFFILSFYLWISNARPEIKYPALFIVLLLGIFTRLTFAFYAVVIGIVAAVEIWKLENKSRVYLIILASCFPFVLWGASFLYPNPNLPLWNIYSYNATIHGMGFSADALANFFPHLRGFLRYARPFLFIGIPLILSIFSSIYYGSFNQKKNGHLFLAAMACFSFASLHFFGDSPLLEYYVPAIMFLVVISVWFLFSFTATKSGINNLILWAGRATLGFIVVALITAGKFGIANYNLYEGHPPIRTLQEIAKVVSQYYPSQPIFALEGLYVAVETNRDVLPGLSMAQFSILDMSKNEVNEIHMVNTEMIVDILKSPDTKILILTEREIASLDKSINGLNNILETNYMNTFEIDHFGQKSVKAYVFIRK